MTSPKSSAKYVMALDQGTTSSRAILFDGDGRLKFSNLLKSLNSRIQIIVTFLAILELVRDGTCILSQLDNFAEIELVQISDGY